MIEEWKDIKGFDGDYQVSNFGRVKSMERFVDWKNTKRLIKSKILKPIVYSNGYLYVGINKKMFRIHTLVWDNFGSEKRNGLKLQVDHIDNNKLNNRLNNLQLLTARQNVNKVFDNKFTASDYYGVYYRKDRSKWCGHISINGKNKYLGSFETELEASNAYQSALKKIIK